MIFVITAAHESVADAQAEMKTKINMLMETDRRLWYELYPFDTAVLYLPDLSYAEKELLKIRDGYFGTRVLVEHGQTYINAT